MSLCELCSSIPFANLPDLPESLENSRPGWKYIHAFRVWRRKGEEQLKGDSSLAFGIPYHLSLESLRAAAEGCGLCNLVLDAVDKFVAELESVTEERRLSHNNRPGIMTYEFFIAKRRGLGEGFWVFTKSENEREVYLVATIGFCVREDNVFSSSILGRPVEEDPGNRVTLDRAVAWVKDCNELQYADVPAQPLPRRVIDVGDDNDGIKLLETEDQSGTYITLSHCWGAVTHLVTTQASLAGRQNGISFTELPKSFQDAIILTRELGVRYLWIDSLCICQDDGADWERESAKMASVYSKSYLTIAATRATDSSVGLFAPRTPPKYFTVPYTSADGVSGTVEAFNLPLRKEAERERYIEMLSEPLSQRAWALQERVLTHRTLHYGKHQMYFECRHGFAGENGTRFDERHIHPPLSYFNFDLEKEPNKFVKSEIEDPKTQWYDLVRAYGPRKLTHASDKLPALSGLAQVFGEKLKDEYVAGLWRNSLVEGLFWQSFGGGVRRVDEYRAPSWSWASIDGRTGARSAGDRTHMATIIDCRVELTGSNPYGEVKSGWIKLQAPLLPLTLDQRVDPYGRGIPYSKAPIVRTKHGDENGDHAGFDVDRPRLTAEDSAALIRSLKDTKLFALVLSRSQDERYSGMNNYFSLIVSPVPDAGEYTMQRLGFLMHGESSSKSFESDPETERPIITLV